jgi:hypothetical protein
MPWNLLSGCTKLNKPLSENIDETATHFPEAISLGVEAPRGAEGHAETGGVLELKQA